MINNISLFRNIKRLPQISESDLISFLLTNFKTVNSLADVVRLNSSALDVSDYKEARDEINSLNIAKYDSWNILAFNTGLTLISKLELFFYNKKLVQGGVQFVFENRLLESFIEIYMCYKASIENEYLIERDAPNWSPYTEQMFNFYDIPPNTPQKKIDFLRKIFSMTESEQKIEALKYLSQRAAEGEFLTPEDLSLHNTVQGYMSLARPALSQTSSLNLRMVDNQWCDLAYVKRDQSE